MEFLQYDMVFAINKKIPPLSQLFIAGIIYAAFAAWLFYPHLSRFAGTQRILLIIPVVSAIGVFLLSTRYVNSFVACFISGIVYGFGSFASAFYTGYHFSAALIYACLPWTFIPAVFLYKLAKAGNKTTNFLAAVFSLLPFIFVFAVYFIAAKSYLYPIPPEVVLTPKSFRAIITPLSFPIDAFSIGFYHAPFGALLVGLVLFFKTRRFWSAILLILAVLLAFYSPVLSVPPVFWLSFVVLICSVIIAEGFEAMVLAGKTDANWLLLSAAALIFQAGLNFALNRVASLPFDSLPVVLSAVSVIAVLFVFFIARAGLAMHILRMAVLYTSVLIDVVIVTKNVVNKTL